MSKLYFFHCDKCDSKIPLFEDQKGWVDEEGNIGYYLTFEQQPDGEPKGDWEIIDIHDTMCVNCNTIYGLIFNNIQWQLKPDAPTLEEKTVQILKGLKVNQKDGTIKGHKVFTVTNKCPQCNGELLTASQLIEKAKISVESPIVNLKPEDTKDRVMKCPSCKKGLFQFDYALKYS